MVLVEFSPEYIQESDTAVVGELCNGIQTGTQQGLIQKPVGLITLCSDLVHDASRLQDDSLSAGAFL